MNDNFCEIAQRKCKGSEFSIDRCTCRAMCPRICKFAQRVLKRNIPYCDRECPFSADCTKQKVQDALNDAGDAITELALDGLIKNLQEYWVK